MFIASVKFLLAVFIVIVCVSPQSVFACSCATPSPIYKDFKTANAVFTGKVISAKRVKRIVEDESEESEDEEMEYQFQVIEVFKNIKGKQVTINGGLVNTSCFRKFDIGESYLIYAYGENENGLRASLGCGRTKVLRDAQDQAVVIRDLLKGKAEPQIYGSVVRDDTTPQTLDDRTSYLANIKVAIYSDNKRIETKTDKNGIFRFDNIPPGNYKIEAFAPPIYNNDYPKIWEGVEILPSKVIRRSDDSYFIESEGDKNIFVSFSFYWNNKIKGNVFDYQGNTFANVWTKLLPVAMMNYAADLNADVNSYIECETTFDFTGETPGQYVLAGDIYAPFADKNRIRVFYSLDDSSNKPFVFNVSETSDFNVNLKMPKEIIPRKLTGEVVRSNGVVVDNALVILAKNETTPIESIKHGENNYYGSVKTDESGKFELQAFENAEYWIHVSTEIDIIKDGEASETTIWSKPIKVKVGAKSESVKIVFDLPENATGSE